jgi:hypothetical protein
MTHEASVANLATADAAHGNHPVGRNCRTERVSMRGVKTDLQVTWMPAHEVQEGFSASRGHASIAQTLDTYSHVLKGMDSGIGDAMDAAVG